MKIGVVYGDAEWLGPLIVPLRVALVGRIDRGLDEFVQRCQRITQLRIEMASESGEEGTS